MREKPESEEVYLEQVLVKNSNLELQRNSTIRSCKHDAELEVKLGIGGAGASP